MRPEDQECFDHYPALGLRLRTFSATLAAPPHLENRLREALAREAARQSRRRHVRFLTAAGATAAITAVLVLVSGLGGSTPARHLAREAQRGLAKAAAMESSDSAALAQWLESVVGYGVEIPAITGARLVGASVADLGGVRGAAVVYRYRTTELTYFALPGVDVVGRSVPEGGVTGGEAYGYEVALWIERGTARAVAASMPREFVLDVAEECRRKAVADRRR